MEKERWLPIIGYEDAYDVSSYGRIRSKARQLIRGNGIPMKVAPRILKFGYSNSNKKRSYYTVGLAKMKTLKTQRVHRLVARAFCEGYAEELHVNHIDGNKLNNHYTNLEYCTHQENIKHAIDNGLFDGSMAKRKTIIQLTKDNVFVREIFSASSLSKEEEYDKGHILKCCHGERQTHRGYKWMFKEDYENQIKAL